ncbi:MAG: enoyl-CoA hydratase/isomerase family protein [Bacteroidia bacterium]|nr:enoyl-CoA hydratase/isomerase family protein [Bacteroidia bacterium]
MKSFKTIELKLNDGIGTVWLNRPEVHNAFNNVMIKDLTECFGYINDMDDIVAVVLRGREKSFCAGADLNWMRDVAKYTYEQNFSESRELSECLYRIYTCKKPTITLAYGAVIGGGNGLLSACDMAYCDDDTTFSLSEIKIGIIPACISPYVVKRIGEYGAKDLMLSGRRIKGKEAEWYRLVNKSVEPDHLNEYVNNVIEILKTSGPKAVTHCKNLIYAISNTLSLDEAHDYTAKMIADIRASAEGQEGMAAFLEKRKPNWVKG